MKKSTILFALVALMAIAASPADARTQFEHVDRSLQVSAVTPAWCSANHDIGKLGLAVGNDGTTGNLAVAGRSIDCFTGESILQGEYPLGNGTMYFWGGALWIGAIVGRDTLVSTGSDGWSRPGNEFHPESSEYGGGMVYRSTIYPDKPTYDGAVSEQDYIAVFRDTCQLCVGVSRDIIDGRWHIPLNLEITQRSYAWSYPAAEDFILVDYSIKNIGSQPLEDLCIGFYMDQDVHDLDDQGGGGAQDDIVGMWTGSHPASRETGCEAPIELEMPWIADNDGDLNQPVPVLKTVTGVAGIRLLKLAGNAPEATFNWWISNGNPAYDWGPMRRAIFRDFGTGGSGTPEGDRNKYYLLSNGDRDYDLVKVGLIGMDDTTWLPPLPEAFPDIVTGLDSRYLVSSGNLSLEPGQSVPLTLAYVCGENLHTSGENFANLPYNPEAYLAGLDFSDFLDNGVWAGWVYDNPGIDTDSDGYAGMFQVCGDDTLWYQGDGVPDWSVASPPVAPVATVEPRDNALYIRWNGFACEDKVDWVSRDKTFEGYRMYLSTDGGPGSFARIGSYDVEDYYHYYWDFGRSAWVRSIGRLTLGQARCRYAPAGCDDQTWHTQDFTRQAPYVMPGYPDSIIYFLPVMANSCLFGLETPFLKRFSDAPRPNYLRPSDVPSDSVGFYLTEDGFFKYFEYEMLIEDLIPSQDYWIAVTSFDYGSMVPGAEPVESSVLANVIRATPNGPCCEGIVGNTNCDESGSISLADVTALIDFLYISGAPLCCLTEADVNQSGGSNPAVADITLADVMILIDYLFITGPSLGLPACQ